MGGVGEGRRLTFFVFRYLAVMSPRSLWQGPTLGRGRRVGFGVMDRGKAKIFACQRVAVCGYNITGVEYVRAAEPLDTTLPCAGGLRLRCWPHAS